MDDLTYDLRQLCRRNRDGSHETQAGRLGGLTLIGKQLRELGFRQMHATSLKAKHVEALIARWQAEGISAGTQKSGSALSMNRCGSSRTNSGSALSGACAR